MEKTRKGGPKAGFLGENNKTKEVPRELGMHFLPLDSSFL